MTTLTPNEPTRQLLKDILDGAIPQPISQPELKAMAGAYDNDPKLVELLTIICELQEEN